MFNLLNSLNLEKITYYASMAAVAGLVIAAIIIILSKKKSNNSKSIVYAAVSIAMSFVLSFIKIYELPYGGSITVASFLPLIIYAYSFGFAKALLAGFIYGLLQFVQGPYFINVFQFILDYLLAFMSISVAGIFGTFIKNRKISLLTGAAAVGLVRLFSNFLAGLIFYSEVGSRASILPNIISDIDAIPAVAYSLIYNSLYIIPDILVCIVILFFMLKSEAFNGLLNSFAFASGKKIKTANGISVIAKNENEKQPDEIKIAENAENDLKTDKKAEDNHN